MQQHDESLPHTLPGCPQRYHAPMETDRPRLLPLRLAAAFALVCFGCATPPTDPAQFVRGDAVAVEALVPELARRSEALASARTMRSTCLRTERVPGSEAPIVAQGTLSVRRDPSVILFAVNGGQRIREDRSTRLVIDPLARRATRYEYESGNGRAELGAAALFLDLERLFAAFEIRSFERDVDGALLVHLSPIAGDVGGASQISLLLDDRQDVPREVRVTHRDGGQTTFRILRPNLDVPSPSDRDAFELPISEEFTRVTQTIG